MRSVPILVALLGACKARGPIADSAPCDDAGYAIAARVHACTGDHAAANTMYERFAREADCLSQGNPAPADFACSASVSRLDCAEVAALGDDPLAFLDHPSCDALFGLGGDTGGAP